MSYSVGILRRAQKELAQLSKQEYERIKEAIKSLTQDPRPAGCKKLSGREGWRIRVGNYRVIYEINDPQQSLTILHIGHRRDVYK
ncbi:MAG TPA: type II toxin-antitoxin system RelE/ParE family toxin [Blastocatellia bacterium]|nr:type II toxin-antitoxin system RelE/ParE family toxin [Blastocatellia bacterium]